MTNYYYFLIFIINKYLVTVWSAVVITDNTTGSRTTKSIWAFLQNVESYCDGRISTTNLWGELFKKSFGSLKSEVRKRLRTAYCAHHIVWLWQLNLRNLRVQIHLAIETWPAWFRCFQENTGITYLNRTRLFPCPSPRMWFTTIPIRPTSFGSTKIQYSIQRIASHINSKRRL